MGKGKGKASQSLPVRGEQPLLASKPAPTQPAVQPASTAKLPAREGEWVEVKRRRQSTPKVQDKALWLYLSDYIAPRTGRKLYRGDFDNWRQRVVT